MSLTYAVPDLHGRFDLFQMAMAEISKRGGTKVVFTGDYVDRGPQSREIIETLIQGPPNGQEWICLKGNHEDLMVNALFDQENIHLWLMNGGGATAKSYGEDGIPIEHAYWMNNLPLFHETKHRIYVHAGGDETLPLSQQTQTMLCWSRCSREHDYMIDGKHVVHGHTPFVDGPVLLQGRTNLDTYAVGTGRLVVGVFDDDVPGGPIDILEFVIGDHYDLTRQASDQKLGASTRLDARAG